MRANKQLTLEKEGLVGLKNLVEVYEEVAATRMQKVRAAVLQSRLFTEGLVNVFAKVRTAYKKLPNKPASLRHANNKTVAVLVSANSGLYGEIIDNIFTKFSDYVEKNKVDVVVIGRLGMKTMTDRLPNILFNYFDFPDDSIDMEGFDMIIRYLIQFEKILVFHGQFNTILNQQPIITPVSGDNIPTVNDAEGDINILFEPSVEAIAKIFEGEIMASIFEQAMHESMLAKYASRLLLLDRSYESIDKRLGEVFFEERKFMHRFRNKKQLGTISGVSLW